MPGFSEFVILMALMISLVALSIDAMLPALPAIGRDLGVVRANSNQLVISLLILGMAIGQIFYGPFSDSFGRKPAIYAGCGLFILGCLLSIFASQFWLLLSGRVLQGLGAAGPRSVTLALVRDRYSGRQMARVMSIVMTVFILVPAIAPSLGQALLVLGSWRIIFAALLVLAAIALVWFYVRQPETLSPDKRIAFSWRRIGVAVGQILQNPNASGYTVASGLIFGAFLGYLNSAQQIFQVQYGLGDRFPLYFGVLALALGSASLLNSRLVVPFGMRTLTTVALLAISTISFFYLAVSSSLAGTPPLWSLMIFLVATFFCTGILFGNLNALAMEPLGHIAGIGAAVVGSLSSLLSVPLGTWIGQSYNGTVLPLVSGYAAVSLACLLTTRWIQFRIRKGLHSYGGG